MEFEEKHGNNFPFIFELLLAIIRALKALQERIYQLELEKKNVTVNRYDYLNSEKSSDSCK